MLLFNNGSDPVGNSVRAVCSVRIISSCAPVSLHWADVFSCCSSACFLWTFGSDPLVPPWRNCTYLLSVNSLCDSSVLNVAFVEGPGTTGVKWACQVMFHWITAAVLPLSTILLSETTGTNQSFNKVQKDAASSLKAASCWIGSRGDNKCGGEGADCSELVVVVESVTVEVFQLLHLFFLLQQDVKQTVLTSMSQMVVDFRCSQLREHTHTLIPRRLTLIQMSTQTTQPTVSVPPYTDELVYVWIAFSAL